MLVYGEVIHFNEVEIHNREVMVSKFILTFVLSNRLFTKSYRALKLVHTYSFLLIQNSLGTNT